MSVFFGVFFGFFVVGIVKMDGVGGYEGWCWIFIIEGIVIVVFGIVIFFFFIDIFEFVGRWLDFEEVCFL